MLHLPAPIAGSWIQLHPVTHAQLAKYVVQRLNSKRVRQIEIRHLSLHSIATYNGYAYCLKMDCAPN